MNFRFKFHLACSTDPLRLNMQCVYFKDAYLYATDANLAVKFSLSDLGLTEEEIIFLDGKYIHSNTFTQIYNKELSIVDGELHCNALNMRVDFIKEIERYPNIDAVIPDEVETIEKIGITPKLMIKMMQIFDFKYGGVKLMFSGQSKAIIVQPIDEDFSNSIGLIMPYKLPE